MLVLGLFTAAIPYFAIAWGQTRITSSLGGILFATIPVFTIVVAPVFIQDERITGTKLLGAALGFTGVIMSVGIGLAQGLPDQFSGAVVTLIAAISYAVGNIYTRMKSGISPMVMATGQLICGSFLLVPLSVLLEQPLQLAPSQAAIVSVLIIVVICTALPVLMMFWLVWNAGVSNTSNVAFFIPVAAVLPGAVLLKQPITALSISGFWPRSCRSPLCGILGDQLKSHRHERPLLTLKVFTEQGNKSSKRKPRITIISPNQVCFDFTELFGQGKLM